MLLLALDTSTRHSSIALSSESQLYGEYTWYSGNNHNTELFEYTQQLCVECHMTLQQIEAVAVAIGPGSFNGVRVAVATAKALAFALKIPLVGVSTLEISAAQHPFPQSIICSLLEAGRSELYAACFTLQKSNGFTDNTEYAILKQLGDYLVVTPEQLAKHLEQYGSDGALSNQQPDVLFCGELQIASQQAIQQAWQGRCTFMTSPASTRRAAVLASLAFTRIQEQRVDDPFVLEPLYLRRPSITQSTRKQRTLGAATS